MEHCMHEPSNSVYLEKWYDVCASIFKSMSWSHLEQLSPNMDDTIINAWCQAEEGLDEDEWKYSTAFIFECLMGNKLNMSTPEGHKVFNNFTTAYNSFCVEQNFKAAKGFPESQDGFFKFYSANMSTNDETMKTTTTQPMKTVRFTSAPPIATLLNSSVSPPKEFPKLVAPTKAPISYTSVTSAFILVTCQ